MVIPVTSGGRGGTDHALPASTPRVRSYKIGRREPEQRRLSPSFYQLFCHRQLQACSVILEEFIFRLLTFGHCVILGGTHLN